MANDQTSLQDSKRYILEICYQSAILMILIHVKLWEPLKQTHRKQEKRIPLHLRYLGLAKKSIFLQLSLYR